MTERVEIIAAKIEAFIRTEVIPYEKDPRTGPHGPSDELVQELRDRARKAGVLTPHILPDGSHLTQLETAKALIKTGLSPLGPLACNTMAPDEGNMYLLGKVGSAEQKTRFLEPLVSGKARSGVLHDRAGGRRRRGLGPVDDADHVQAGWQSLGHQRAEEVHYRS